MISFKADLRKLLKKAERIAGIKGRFRDTNREMADELVKLVDEGFSRRSDPSGKKWRRRKQQRPWPILERTGGLRGSFEPFSSLRSFGARTSSPHAGFHQGGTRRMVRRAMLPLRGMPRKWRRRLVAILDRSLAEAVNG